jgi:recombination protein RecA
MQKLGGNAMLVDAEHAFDPAYSKSLGVDIENLIVCQPDNGEMALESNTFSTCEGSVPVVLHNIFYSDIVLLVREG